MIKDNENDENLRCRYTTCQRTYTALAEYRYCYCCPYDRKAKLVLSSLNTLQYA
jgi:hypothetical protein